MRKTTSFFRFHNNLGEMEFYQETMDFLVHLLQENPLLQFQKMEATREVLKKTFHVIPIQVRFGSLRCFLFLPHLFLKMRKKKKYLSLKLDSQLSIKLKKLFQPLDSTATRQHLNRQVSIELYEKHNFNSVFDSNSVLCVSTFFSHNPKHIKGLF